MATRSPQRRPSCSPLQTINRVERALRQLQAQGKNPAHDVRLYAQAVLDEVADVPCAILIANDYGRYIIVNAAAVELTGYPRTQLLHMSVWDLTPAATLRESREQWRQFVRSERMRGMYDIRRRNGEVVRARFVAVANVVPGLHVSALVAAGRRIAQRSRAKKKTTKKR